MLDDDIEQADDAQLTGSARIYFLTLVDPANPDRDFGLVKVGITRGAVERRIENLQTGNPYRIQCADSFQSPVASAVECWVHRTHRVAHLEWLQLRRPEIQGLVNEAKLESERLARIAESTARWSQVESNGTARKPSADEVRLHAAAQGVIEDWLSTKLQRELTMMTIAVRAGSVGHIPGIVQVWPSAAYKRFQANIAIERFPELTANHTVEKVKGSFRWQNVATLGRPQWKQVRADLEALKRARQEIDADMLRNRDRFLEEGPRTDELEDLHEGFIALTPAEDSSRYRQKRSASADNPEHPRCRNKSPGYAVSAAAGRQC